MDEEMIKLKADLEKQMDELAERMTLIEGGISEQLLRLMGIADRLEEKYKEKEYFGKELPEEPIVESVPEPKPKKKSKKDEILDELTEEDKIKDAGLD